MVLEQSQNLGTSLNDGLDLRVYVRGPCTSTLDFLFDLSQQEYSFECWRVGGEGFVDGAPMGLCLLLHRQFKFVFIKHAVVIQIIPTLLLQNSSNLLLRQRRVGYVQGSRPMGILRSQRKAVSYSRQCTLQ